MRKLLIALTISLFLMPLVLSASYVVGLVGNASDGTDANGYVITLWNTTAGVTDNRTDTIGVSGGSGTANYFMIDCELLATPCVVGDNVSVQVFDNGSNYTTNISSVLIAGAVSNAPYVVLMENATILEGGATLRGVFKLNEGSGNTIYDSLQNLSNGLKSGATWVTDGILNTLTSGVDYTISTSGLFVVSSSYLFNYMNSSWSYLATWRDTGSTASLVMVDSLGNSTTFLSLLIVISFAVVILTLFKPSVNTNPLGKPHY